MTSASPADPLRATLALLAAACVALAAVLGVASAVAGAPVDAVLADPLPRLQVLLIVAGAGLALAAVALAGGEGSRRGRLALFATPFLAILAFALYKRLFGLQDPAYLVAVDEDHSVEWLTFLGLALATVHFGRAAGLAWRGRARVAAVVLGLLAAFCLLVALEEISYGQRVFGFETPDELSAVNRQGEFNLHNVRGVQWLTDDLLPMVVIGYFLAGWLVLGLVTRLAPRLAARLPALDLLVPPWYVAPFLLPLAIFRVVLMSGFPDQCCEPGQFMIWQDQEPAEMFFGLGFLVFGWDRFREANRRWAGGGRRGLVGLIGAGARGLGRQGARVARGERGVALPAALVLVALALVQVPFVRTPDRLQPGLAETNLSEAEIAAVDAALAPSDGLAADCDGDVGTLPECRTAERPTIALWGDGAAEQLADALAVAAGEAGVVQLTKNACMAALGIALATQERGEGWSEGCIAHNDEVLAWLGTQPEIELVVMSSPLGLIEWPIRTRDGQVVPGPRPDLVRQALAETAERLRAMGKTPVFTSRAPSNSGQIADCLRQAALAEEPQDACDFVWNRDRFSAYAFMEGLEATLPVVYLDELLCADGLCDTRIDDVMVYGADDRLSEGGARLLGTSLGLLDRIREAAGG